MSAFARVLKSHSEAHGIADAKDLASSRATKPKWSTPSVLAKYLAFSSDNFFIDPKKRR
jgi:hypothetical protein